MYWSNVSQWYVQVGVLKSINPFFLWLKAITRFRIEQIYTNRRSLGDTCFCVGNPEEKGDFLLWSLSRHDDFSESSYRRSSLEELCGSSCRGDTYTSEGDSWWYIWTTPHPATVTTRNIPFLEGNPYKPSFVTVTGWGGRPKWYIWVRIWIPGCHDKLLRRLKQKHVLGICGNRLTWWWKEHTTVLNPMRFRFYVITLMAHQLDIFCFNCRTNPFFWGYQYVPMCCTLSKTSDLSICQ